MDVNCFLLGWCGAKLFSFGLVATMVLGMNLLSTLIILYMEEISKEVIQMHDYYVLFFNV